MNRLHFIISGWLFLVSSIACSHGVPANSPSNTTNEMDTVASVVIAEDTLWRKLYPNNRILEGNTIEGISKKMLYHEDLEADSPFYYGFLKTVIYKQLYFKRDGVQKLFVVTLSRGYDLGEDTMLTGWDMNAAILAYVDGSWELEIRFADLNDWDKPFWPFSGNRYTGYKRDFFGIRDGMYVLDVVEWRVYNSELDDRVAEETTTYIRKSYNIETMEKVGEMEVEK